MIIDKLEEFCSATALSQVGTGKALVGNVVDTGSVVRDIGVGQRLYLVGYVTTTVLAAGGASTVVFILASDAQAAIAADGTATEHFKTAAIPKATLVAGYKICAAPLPQANPAYERYLGILQDVATNALTAGAVSFFITETPDAWTSYAPGTAV